MLIQYPNQIIQVKDSLEVLVIMVHEQQVPVVELAFRNLVLLILVLAQF